ncbi:MAG: hypothetical protein ACRENA_04680 [Vulcanimicrobiaceae bacterium]
MKALSIVLAIAFFALAGLYWTGAVQFGVHEASGPHHKHAVLFAALGILSLIWFRFQTSSPSRVR